MSGVSVCLCVWCTVRARALVIEIDHNIALYSFLSAHTPLLHPLLWMHTRPARPEAKPTHMRRHKTTRHVHPVYMCVRVAVARRQCQRSSSRDTFAERVSIAEREEKWGAYVKHARCH